MSRRLLALLVVFAVFGGIAALLTWLFRAAGKSVEQERARVSSARPGRAKITNMVPRGVYRGTGRDRLVWFELEVTPQGGAAYTAQSEWFIQAIAASRAQPGQEIEVKIDAVDITVIYPAEEWATLR